jgi:hypothetical protein
LAIACLQEGGLLLAGVDILSLLVLGLLVWTSAGVLENLLGGSLHVPWRKG